MAKNSTDYYRENKKKRRVVHYCPHCDFETTYGKCVLTNHVNAHHTKECDRPWQCSCCDRGFAQKAHLVAHLKKVHNVVDRCLEKKNGAVLYLITLTNQQPKSYKTQARKNYYITHPRLNSRDIKNKKHCYINDDKKTVYLKNHDIHYDEKKGFIKLNKIQLKQPLKINSKFKAPLVYRCC